MGNISSTSMNQCVHGPDRPNNCPLPEDVILEILHRLPIKYIVQCMAVCKWWKKLITNPSFISRNLLNGSLASANQKPLLLLRHHHLYSTTVNHYSLHFENGEFDETRDFKLVRISGKGSRRKTMIYSVDKGCWRTNQKQNAGNAPIFPYKQRIFRAAVCVGGILHSIATRVGSSGDNVIVSYDLRDEAFGEVMLPDCIARVQYSHKYHYCISISTYKDSSIMVCGDLGTHYFPIIQVWVMKEYGVVDSWMKLSIDNGGLGIRKVLRFSSNDKLLLFLNSMGLVFLNPNSGGMFEDPTRVEAAGYHDANLCPFVESLALLDNTKARECIGWETFL
ncbi:hypothetical protein Tsubulata_037432 [Turnera subulata]|uniref:F-box domain-containing protein n=1 Tax=Turnera subulata TaxID=218843 RepID=A0A9Q0J2S8_9ROSI|nr:hypothetical protein Tsubulata_037432 [Turnera subulata]